MTKIGDIIKFGNYNWRVLYVQDNKALIITEHIIEQRPYNGDFTDITWENCTLRHYLNNEFLQKFTHEQQSQIIETKNQTLNNQWYGTAGGNDTDDKVFLLSLKEVCSAPYFGDSMAELQNLRKGEWGFSDTNNQKRISKFNNCASWWWLRTPGAGYLGALIGDAGGVYVRGLDVGGGRGGVRPALWLKI